MRGKYVMGSILYWRPGRPRGGADAPTLGPKRGGKRKIQPNRDRKSSHIIKIDDVCLAVERGVYAASWLGWRARQKIPRLAQVRTLKRRKRRAPIVPGTSGTLNSYK